MLLKWKHIKTSETELESKSDQIYYIVEIQNTVPKSGTAPQWQSVYQGKGSEIQHGKLQASTEYLSRVKARYLNIEGDPSANQFFSTAVIATDKVY